MATLKTHQPSKNSKATNHRTASELECN